MKRIIIAGCSAFAVTFLSVSLVNAQDVVFRTGFEYGSEPIVFEPSDLDGADDQVGSWSGPEFPEGIGDILILPDSVGFIDNPNNGRAMLVDRPGGDLDGNDFIGSYFAELANSIELTGAQVSFDVGTRRTGGNNNKDYDIIGRDEDGSESFHLRVGANNNGGERLGVITDQGDTVTFDLPTVVGNDGPADLDNLGAPPFADNDEIGRVSVNLAVEGYTIDFRHVSDNTANFNEYTTDLIPYNGEASRLAKVEFTYSASGNTGVNSGYMLDNILVTGFEQLLLGDFNQDGNLDAADFMVLADNFGTGTTGAEGDFNFDGRVDLFDFVAFKAAFNAASQGQAATSVPEPAGCTVLVVGLAALLTARRRRN